MNKKALIGIVITILIVILAIFVGVKLGKKEETKTTNTNPVEKGTPTPITEATEIPTPVEETPSPEATQLPVETPTTQAQSPSVLDEDISGFSSSQKEDYAKRIAKEFWEKTGSQVKVYYNVDNIDINGKYVITVRDEASTEALIWYEIDINNKTCETIN